LGAFGQHANPVLSVHRIGTRSFDAEVRGSELKRFAQELTGVEADKVPFSWWWRWAELVIMGHAFRTELRSLDRARYKYDACPHVPVYNQLGDFVGFRIRKSNLKRKSAI